MNAKEVEVPKSFRVELGEYAFSIAAPTPPDNEFITHNRSISVYDEALFKKSKRVLGLNVHWTFKTGLFRKVAGVVELKVYVNAAGDDYNVASEDELKQELLNEFKRELVKVGYAGESVPFESIVLDRRTWLRYPVPVIGLTEYASGLTKSRYLAVQFAFVDNTGEPSPAWHQEAKTLVQSLVESIRVEKR